MGIHLPGQLIYEGPSASIEESLDKVPQDVPIGDNGFVEGPTLYSLVSLIQFVEVPKVVATSLSVHLDLDSYKVIPTPEESP